MKIKRLRRSAIIPKYATDGSCAVDLHADFKHQVGYSESMWIWALGAELIPTGISIAIPNGFGGFIFPRSGLGHKQGLTLGNGTGIVDSDYRGEIFVSLYNRSPQHPVKIHQGDRIAQLIIMPYQRVEFEEVEELDETERGAGGFGSSGK